MSGDRRRDPVDGIGAVQYVSAMGGWRRVSDWKREVTVVAIADVPPSLIEARGWALPSDRIAARWPQLAMLARETGIARVDGAVAKALRAEGIVTHELGYHRGSDGWAYRRRGAGDTTRSGDAAALVAELMGDRDDDDVYDRLSDDVVDAIFRVCSDERVDERALIVAAELPTLGPAAERIDVEEGELDRLEALGAGSLPERASAEVLEAVRAQLSAPAIPKAPSAANGNVRKALGWAVALAALSFFFRERAPMVAAIGLALSICALVIALLAKVQKS